MGAPPPWGQSLLRSCLAAHSARRAALRGRRRSCRPPPPARGAAPDAAPPPPDPIFTARIPTQWWPAPPLGVPASSVSLFPPLRGRTARTRGVGAGRGAVYPDARLAARSGQ